MKKYQNKILLVLRLLIAFLFLFSAYAKLHPTAMMQGITTFQTNHLIPMGFSDSSAAYFSRFIIGVEFFLGITILFNYYLKRLIIPLTIIMITAFSIHLLTQLGSDAPCGCNGTLLPMKPWQALIKNAITLIVLTFMYKKYEINRDVEGVIITRVDQNSEAYEMGVREGNLIQRVGSKKISSKEEFHSLVEESKGDGAVLLLIKQGDSSRFFALDLRD